MAGQGRYELRSHAEDHGGVANQPNSLRPLRTNSTQLKMLLGGYQGSGMTAPRWIQELTNGTLPDCTAFQQLHGEVFMRCRDDNHRHDLILNTNQSSRPGSVAETLSCVCKICDFHFIIRTRLDPEHAQERCDLSQTTWPVDDNSFPLHHLLFVQPLADEEVAKRRHDQFYPLVACYQYICSAPPCTFELDLEISTPRLPLTWIKLLRDDSRIRQNLRAARDLGDGRFDNMKEDEAAFSGPRVLHQYLLDLLGDGPLKNISQRNKRFLVVMGPECRHIFQELGYKEETLPKDDVDEEYLVPQRPDAAPDGEPTPLGSRRAYIEDVRLEVESLIIRTGGKVDHDPVAASNPLARALHCFQYRTSNSRPRDDSALYRILGAKSDFSQELIFYAYKRQRATWSNNAKLLTDALCKLAEDFSDPFQTAAVLEASMVESPMETPAPKTDADEHDLVWQSYQYFGFEYPCSEPDDSIISAFNNFVSSKPDAADTARMMLDIIAGDRSSKKIKDAGKARMTPEVAVRLLHSELHWSEENIALNAKITWKDKKGQSDAKAELLEALDIVGQHKDSVLLQRTARELRSKGDDDDDDDLMIDASEDTTNLPVNFDLPAGLENIGNTCYLNSLLQYLYTVKAVRELVLNYGFFRLDLTEANISSRKVGGTRMTMDRAEGVVAQAFVSELANLFNDLRTTPKKAARPTQRLANAVLLSTHRLLKGDAKEPPKEQTTQLKPPPLPARQTPAKPISEDIEMDTIREITDPNDSSSVQSSRTLVEDQDIDPDRSYEKVEKVAPGHDAMEVSQELEQRLNDTSNSQPPSNTYQNEQDQRDGDVIMVDGGEDHQPLSIDETVLNALEHQKRSSGTDQQDVEEVMGSILYRLQSAIKPDRVVEETGVQMERIMESFFVTLVNYTKNSGESAYKPEVVLERSITAYPAESGPCSLYEALDRNFDRQKIEGTATYRFSSIKHLPPILHVLIQRTKKTGDKNMNPVTIEETLVLDRYLDGDEDSDLMRRRREGWMLRKQLENLSTGTVAAETPEDTISFLNHHVNYAGPRKSAVEMNGDPAGNLSMDADSPVDLDPVQRGEYEVVSLLDGEPTSSFEFDGFLDEESKPLSQRVSNLQESMDVEDSLPLGPEILAQDYCNRIKAMKGTDTRKLESQLRDLWVDMNCSAYKLHAVICHAGQLIAGHYWVYIRDFEAGVWRKYNDTQVTEHSTSEVLELLNQKGDPYYLCYVADTKEDSLVNVLKREPMQESGVSLMARSSSETLGRQSPPSPNETLTEAINQQETPLLPDSTKTEDDRLPSYEEAQETKSNA